MTTSGSPSRVWSRRGALVVLVLAPLAGGQLIPPALTTPAGASASIEDEPVGTEITLKDGRKVSGTLVEQTPERIVLSIGGIATTFKMDVVDKVQTLPSVAEQYARVRDSIDPEDVEGLLRLAEWLRAHERYDFALVEVERALKVEPANPDAKALRTLIVEQQKIAGAGGAVPKPGPLAPRLVPKPPDFPLLTPEQINLIRVFEVDIKDPPRMRVDRKTVSQFIDKYAGKAINGKGAMPTTPEGRAVFHTKKPAEILDWMFGLKAREFYGEVQVMENPRSLQLFRDHVNRTWLVNSCATNNCHGGEEAGRLMLYNKRQGSDQAAYTNFLILDRFKLDNGMPLITYTEPAQSPLLQMGLPQNQAVIKHPPIPSTVKGKWQPIFRGPEDEKYQQALEWIKSMYAPRPEYPVDYKAPVPHPKAVAPAAPAGDATPAVPGER